MELIDSTLQMKQVLRELDPKLSVGFVPTMGALHAGHLSLVEQSTQSCDRTVVSIFVNPAQFGPKEDLSKYPRDLDKDLDSLSRHQVDYVFFPTSEEMYPAGYRTWIEVSEISDILCGASRPGHFRGVATVVMKLAQIVKPDKMFMGLKDYQQIVVLETMLRDLNSDTRIVRCPIVREQDGLALSSRNIYLDRAERISALCLSQAIKTAKKLVARGQKDATEIIRAAEETILNAGGKPDYIKLVDGSTLAEVSEVDENTRLILAVFVGKTRLIDNDALSV